MPRKRASASSPEKPAAPTRRNTRRGRNKSEAEEEVAPPVAEIPRHLLRGSDESSEQSDNDSDYGSPKKGRGRGKATGRGRKPKESPEKPTPRARRGRRGAAAKEASPDRNVEEEPDNNSQSTQETAETTTENEATEPSHPVQETLRQAEPEQTNVDNSNYEQEPSPIVPSSAPVTHVIEEEKVSEVTIEQDLQSNTDQAPVNEEERDGSNDNDDVETGRKSVEDVNENVEDEKADSPPAEPEKVIEIDEADSEPEKVIELDEEESKDAPESSAAQSETRSRSNSSEKEVRPTRRERSSSGEIQEESCEKMEVETTVEIPSKRKSVSPQKLVEAKKAEVPPVEETPVVVEEKAPQPAQRKRRWTARKTEDQPVIAITTDSLKTIISEEVKPMPLSDVKLLSSSPEPEPEEKRQRTKATAEDKDAKKKLLKERLRKQEEEEERRNEQLVIAIDKHQASSNGTAANGSALLKDRKISIIVDDPVPAPSPPKNESSNILYITNLVRPFTVLQLKGLLARTGKIAEQGFWIDKIKSKCFVKYETEDEAFETRHALHGVTWPSSNPKSLHVDFGKEEDMEKAIISTMDSPRIQITTENRDVKEEKEFGWSKDPYKNSSAEDRSRSSHTRPVREWDVGKKDKEEFDREDRDRNRRKRSSERENRREKDKKEERPEKRRSVSESPGREKVEGEAQPVRLLDDLFRKTKATPCIYWLPLSAEQIIEKEEQRQKNLAEHARRMEEFRKQREERIRERKRSNSRDRRRDRSRDKRRRSVSRDRRYNRR